MSYCKHLGIPDIDKLKDYQIEIILDFCEEHCNRYTLCDTAAYMDDKLKEKHNEEA